MRLKYECNLSNILYYIKKKMGSIWMQKFLILISKNKKNKKIGSPTTKQSKNKKKTQRNMCRPTNKAI